MYVLTQEDIDILVNYREFLKGEVESCTNDQAKMILTKSVELLSGEITTATLENYLAVQVKKSPEFLASLTDETKAVINETRIAASKYGVMEVVKRYKQG